LQPAILQRYQQSLAANEVVNIATQNDIRNKAVTLQNEINEWRFTGTHLPDVAFGISDHYLWDGSSVVVDDATGRRASAQAAYAESSKRLPACFKVHPQLPALVFLTTGQG
jgi:hypothetical protein